MKLSFDDIKNALPDKQAERVCFYADGRIQLLPIIIEVNFAII